MKVGILFMLMILLITTLQVHSDDRCDPKKNYFLSQLKIQHHLNILESPVFGSTKCGLLWKQNGECCGEQELVRLTQEESKRIDTAVEKTKERLIGYARIFRRLMNLSTQISDTGISAPSRLAFLKVLQKASEDKSFLKILYRINADKYGKFSNSITQCWDKMKSVRSSSLCSICSGNGWRFSKDKQLLLTESTCDGIISACQDSFYYILKFIEGMTTIMNELSEIDNSQISKAGLFKMFENLHKSIAKSNVLSLLDQRINKNSKEFGPNLANSLCSHLVKVREKTFIEELSEILALLNSDILEKIEKRFESITSRKLQGASNYDKTVPPTNTLFTGDVKIVPAVDSSYTSYQGALGTTGNESHKFHSKPLDTSVAFP